MSENNTTPTPEELIEEVTLEIEDAQIVPMPIDPTLTHEGEAAEAKATGEAIAAVIDDLRINGKAPVTKAITLYGSDIYISAEEGAQTLTAAIESIGEQTAEDIIYDPTELITVAGAITSIYETLDTELTQEEIDQIIDDVFSDEEE